MKFAHALLVLAIAAGCVRDGPTAGRRLFVEHCAACHGVNGLGDGPVSARLTTPPPDLTRISERRNGVWPMLEVMRIIDGYAQRTNPRAEMPVISDFLEGKLVKFDTGNGQTTRAPANLLAMVRYLERIQFPKPTSYVP
jgi:cytochrome c peroxidase